MHPVAGTVQANPGDPLMAYSAVALFIFVRLLDDFVFMPMTIGKSLELHPLLTVVMIFAGGAVAGVPGLMLVLPLVGVIAADMTLNLPDYRARERTFQLLTQAAGRAGRGAELAATAPCRLHGVAPLERK